MPSSDVDAAVRRVMMIVIFARSALHHVVNAVKVQSSEFRGEHHFNATTTTLKALFIHR